MLPVRLRRVLHSSGPLVPGYPRIPCLSVRPERRARIMELRQDEWPMACYDGGDRAGSI